MRPLVQDRRVRRLLASLAFCALLAAMIALATAVLRPESGGVSWDSFERLPKDSVDVLVVGNSHAFTCVDPAVVWRVRGIPSFVNAGPAQALDVTEYYIRESLRTQRPSVIALEVSSCAYGSDSFDWPFHTVNINSMPWSMTKLEALWNTTPAAARTEIVFELWSSHGRWPEIKLRDLNLPGKQRGALYLKGFVPNFKALEVSSTPAVLTAEDRAKADAAIDHNAAALRRIAALCAADDVDLLLFASPTASPGLYTYYLERAAQVVSSEEAGVRALDLSAPGAVPGLSYTTDFFDKGHVNWRGAEKASTVLADYIARTYGLPDRRSEPALRSWGADAERRDVYIERRTTGF